jgi:hypothetical protein
LGSLYAYVRGTGVHAAEISTKFANGDTRMSNEIVCRNITDTSQTDPGTHIGTPHMRTGRKAGNFAYGESLFAKRNCAHIGSNIYMYLDLQAISLFEWL